MDYTDITHSYSAVQPKGALHAHRVLLGHVVGVEFPHNFFPIHPNEHQSQRYDQLFWTPADWAWIGGLFDVLLTSLHHGIPVLAHRFKKFAPDAAFHVIAKHRVSNMFMPPTALKLMRQVQPSESSKYNLTNVRTIASGGESLGESLLEWGKQTFHGLTINEFYGQTECNLVVGNCSDIMDIKPSSMGKPIPGHIVHIIDDNGNRVADGTIGNIGILQHPVIDPVSFLRYWNLPEKTKEKYIGNYLVTGDLAKQDSDGYFYFQGRYVR
jgi:acetyl-CoA synthetase